ncbi:MAG: Uma2 family endonuclease [Methylococcales bacterium]
MSNIKLENLPYYTYADYEIWEGEWELINGIPYATAPSLRVNHQAISSLIVFSLTESIKDCEQCLVLMEQDWKLNESTILRPDVMLVCNEPGDAFVTKHPEIIFEVLSKNSIKKDQNIKFEIYQEEKVPYYIIVSPDDLKASLYRLENNKYSKLGDFTHEQFAFDGLTCNARIDFQEVFRRFRDK